MKLRDQLVTLLSQRLEKTEGCKTVALFRKKLNKLTGKLSLFEDASPKAAKESDRSVKTEKENG